MTLGSGSRSSQGSFLGACRRWENLVVIGAQWATKQGKIVDILASDVDVVVRYQGGQTGAHGDQ